MVPCISSTYFETICKSQPGSLDIGYIFRPEKPLKKMFLVIIRYTQSIIPDGN